MRFLSLYRDSARIWSWVRGAHNLMLLRRRVHQEIPLRYRRGFYNTWFYGYLRSRQNEVDLTKSDVSPLTLKLSPTMRCNLKCRGCFAASYSQTGDLSLAQMERIVSQAQGLGACSVGIIGGEPLLVRNMFDLFAAFPHLGFYLVTNGTLVDQDVAARLQTLPNVITVFSIEGFETTNDFLRGDGVFGQIMKGMHLLREARVIFGFSTTVHRENVKEVVSAEYLDFMVDRGCFFGGFLPYVPVGSQPRYDVVCTDAETREYHQRADVLSRSLPLLLFKEGYSDGTFLNQGCGAAGTAHVMPGGEAEPCNGIEFSTMNAHRSSLKDILASDFFRDIRRLHPPKGRKCLTITQPEAVLRVVNKHRASPTHDQAFEHLEEYIRRQRDHRPINCNTVTTPSAAGEV